MRQSQRWTVLLSVPLMAAMFIRAADAQVGFGPPTRGPSPMAGPGFTPQQVLPPGYRPAGAGMPTSAPMAAPQGAPGQVGQDIHGFPATFSPWPEISPYDNTFSQTAYQEGVWSQETTRRTQTYFFTLEYLYSHVKRPERNLVGSFGAPGSDPAFAPVDLGAFWEGTVGLATVDEIAVSQQQHVGHAGRTTAAHGVRPVLRVMEPDDSGVEMSAFWSGKGRWLFSRGFNELGPESVRVTAGLPLNDGFGGVLVPYDRLFKIEMETEVFGAELQWLLTKRWGSDTFHIRPAWGFRYFWINERFSFEGSDSGLAVSFNSDGTPAGPGTPVVDPFKSELQSGISSHLAGPEVGLHYELGGDNLKISGKSMVGVLANRERIKLAGNAIGDGFGPDFFQDSPFSQEEVHTHVSPMLEQVFNVDLNAFRYIPLLRRLPVLEQAKMRISYSLTGIWEVARPGGSIDWFGLPLFPRIKSEREKWYIQSWHFGMHWKY